jgi:leucine dehydrogenase
MLFDLPDFDNHERVLFGKDAATGLSCIIAVHSTTLGPACGGCRMWAYANDAEALRDALRLSRGMSYKNAMAGLPLGGGKSVIIGNSAKDKSDDLFRAFGRVIDSLGGLYVAAEDVGITVADVTRMAETTRHVAGLTQGRDASGDPSPFTAYGVFLGIEVAVRHRLGADSLKGLRVAVQGLGNVGRHLCDRLAQAGAHLIVSDLRPEAVQSVVEAHAATAVAPEAIHAADADVFSPCALGGSIHAAMLDALKAKVVAGGANNQLATPDMGEVLRQRGVLYAPDYVINAGGIINVSAEVTQAYDRQAVMQKVERIPRTLESIFARAEIEAHPTDAIADAMARDLLRPVPPTP